MNQMKVYSIIFVITLVTASYAQICNSSLTQYSHFNLIAVNAGRTDGGVMSTDGPALIFNDYYLDNAVINAEDRITCNTTSGTDFTIEELGLWLGNTGTAQSAINTTVFSGTITDYNDGNFIKRHDDNCRILYNRLAYVPDESIVDNGILISNELSGLMPTHYIDSEANIIEVVNSITSEYYVFTFQACSSSSSCTFANSDNSTSDPRGLLFGESNWEGPTTAWPSDRQIVFNIPVDSDGGLSISGTQDMMANGLTSCKTIWNFYSSSNGTDTFDISFTNSNPIGGLFLAPQGKIKDIQTDGSLLYGHVFANTYTPSSDGDSRLGNYFALGDACEQAACWPGVSGSGDDQANILNMIPELTYETTTSQATSYFIVYTTDDFDTRTGTTLTTISTTTIRNTHIQNVTESVYEIAVIPTTVTVTEYEETAIDTIYNSTTTTTVTATYTNTLYNDVTSTLAVARLGTTQTTLTEKQVSTATVTKTSTLPPNTIYKTTTRTRIVNPQS